METKHTPGPWNTFAAGIHQSATGVYVGSVYGGDGDLVGTAVGDSRINAEANAHLIAAAPELLDRVMGRMDRCPCHAETFDPERHEGRGGGDCADCEADRDAIAKAKSHSSQWNRSGLSSTEQTELERLEALCIETGGRMGVEAADRLDALRARNAIAKGE